MATVALSEGGRRPASVHVAVPAFVGRRHELATIAHALSRPPAVLLVEGEAGIGKSRLIQEYLASAPAGRRPLVGTSLPARRPYPMAPIIDALRQTRPQIATLGLSGLAGALRPMFPEWDADLPPSPEPLEDAAASLYRLFRALAEVIERLDNTLLVVEDLHWADDATIEFLLFLATAHQHDRAGLSLVVTYRPEDVADGSLLLRLTSRLPAGLTQIRLIVPPLTAAETGELASGLLGRPISRDVADHLREQTGGVPLVVTESVRLLAEGSASVGGDTDWIRLDESQLPVAPAVRDLVRERTQALAPGAKRILQAAAVLAEPADETTLAAVANVPAPVAAASLAEALSCGLLGEADSGQLAFRYAMMRRASYEGTPVTVRRQMHLRAGRHLESTAAASAARLAHHFKEANDVEAWCRYALQAAEQASASSDQETVIDLLADVLASARPDMPMLARLTRALGAAALSGEWDIDRLGERVVQSLRAVLEVPGLPTEILGEVHSLLGRLLRKLGDFGGSAAHLERAVPYLAHAPREQAFVMTSLGMPLGDRPASVHRRWLRRAAEVDLSGPSVRERLTVAIHRTMALLNLGEEEGWSVAEELPTSPASAEERHVMAGGLAGLADAAILWGRYSCARDWVDVAVDLAEATGQPRPYFIGLTLRAHLDWLTGAWSDLTDRVTELADSDGHPPARLRATWLAAHLYAVQGSRGRADDYLRRALADAARLGAQDEALAATALQARLWYADGDAPAALRLTQHAVDTLLAQRIWVWATDLAPVHVDVLSTAGCADEAERFVHLFARGLGGRSAPAPRAALAVCRAIIMQRRGEHKRAARAFDRAARQWDALPRPYDALCARERQAECLIAGGAETEGVPLLSEVFAGLARLGATGDADRVARRLREHGEIVRRPWRGGPRGYGDQLSPREVEVVELVIAGKTNREIADVLSRSPKTVAAQLRSAMRKLGVPTRTALAIRAVESGLADVRRIPDRQR